ncbi:MAG: amidohydrolase family protein [Ilumatobacteraceae bacterium]
MVSVFTNGRLRDGRSVDLTVDHGRIVAVDDHGPGRDAVGATDLGGRLLLPPMAEPHAHLDKALTSEAVPNPTGDLAGAIDAWIAADERGVFTYDDMVTRVDEAVRKLVLNGVTAIRTHVNAGGGAGTWHLDATRDAMSNWSDRVDAEFVGLVHTPIVGPGSDDNVAALRACAEGGALVGGCPHLEPDGAAAIDLALALAGEFGVPIDLHTDETLDPSMLTLPVLARRVIDTGFTGRVAASHCVSLGMQPPDVQAEVARLVAEAGIGIITLPQTNLFLQGREQATATPRGLTAVAALRDAGVVVAAGADNVQDPFNLVGRSDPLETAALLVMAAHVLPDDAYEMVSNAPRTLMGLEPVHFAVGDPADFVAIDAPSVRAAIADAPADRLVVHAGRVVATTSTTRTIC